jgi:hypothetical protein
MIFWPKSVLLEGMMVVAFGDNRLLIFILKSYHEGGASFDFLRQKKGFKNKSL